MRRLASVTLALILFAAAIELPLAIHLCLAGPDHHADQCVLCRQVAILAKVFLNHEIPSGIPVPSEREKAPLVSAAARPNTPSAPAVLPRAPPRVQYPVCGFRVVA